MYENEARTRATLLQSKKSASSKLENYITELQFQADNYRKVTPCFLLPMYMYMYMYINVVASSL